LLFVNIKHFARKQQHLINFLLSLGSTAAAA
jgi:hypothetical protein